jgi:MYXO-CTERM domain-containing protein
VPTTDLFGNARADHPDVANGGAGSIDFTDLGAIEAMGVPPAGEESGGADSTATDDGGDDSGEAANDGGDAVSMGGDDAADAADDTIGDGPGPGSDGTDDGGAADDDASGCGCTTTDENASWLWWLVLLACPRRFRRATP